MILFKRLRKRLNIKRTLMTLKKPSIRDVAKKAGVSTATVSHVINKSRFVTTETKNKVLIAIKELGYYPSAAAKSLMSNESKIIGVVFSDISNTFFTEIYMGIEFVLAENNYEVSLANTGESIIKQEKVLKAMLSRGVDGLIIAPTNKESETLNFIVDSEIPVVFLDRYGAHPDIDIIQINNKLSAYDATSHLISDGHKRIGIVIGLENVTTTHQRLEGYKQALDENGIPFEKGLVIKGGSEKEKAYKGVMKLLESKEWPSAIFSTNNLMTLGVLAAFREQNVNCPKDIGLICFDDPVWAEICFPPLSVVKQPTLEIGSSAANILLRKIQEEKTEVISESLEATLIIRGSCSESCYEVYKKGKGNN